MAKANHAAALRGVQSAALRLQEHLVTHVIPQENPTPVDRGVYRAGWHVDMLENGARLRNFVPWAAFIEDGVDPKKVKIGRAMIKALAEWVRRKGIGGRTKTTKSGSVQVTKPSTTEATNIAWAIAKTMKKKGIHGGPGGRGILRKTLMQATFFLESEIKRELDKAEW